MSKKKPCYYWDSCIFIDALRPSNVSDDIDYPLLREYLEDLKHSKIQIVTSSITYTEVYKDGALDDMRKLKDLQIIDPTQAIAIEAAMIRDATNLKTPDAIHLATALYARLEVLHTTDKKLLSLNDAYAPKLSIIKPIRTQRKFI